MGGWGKKKKLLAHTGPQGKFGMGPRRRKDKVKIY